MASLVKARAARKAQLDKKRQEEEEARKKAEEEKNQPPAPPPPPELEKPIDPPPPPTSAPPKEEPPPPPMLEKVEVVEKKEEVAPLEKKLIQPSDLFLIPPSFSFVDLEDKMNGVTITPVPSTSTKFLKKSQQQPSSFSTGKQQIPKKRKREEPVSSEDDQGQESDSEDEPSNPPPSNQPLQKKTSPPPFKSAFKPGGSKSISNSTSSTSSSLMEKARGLYNQTTSYLPDATSTLRNNILFSIGSIFLIIVRGALQKRHLGRIQTVAPLQNIPASLPPVGAPIPPSNAFTTAPPSFSMMNPTDFRGYGR
jgi:hypothetical protein